MGKLFYMSLDVNKEIIIVSKPLVKLSINTA